MKFLPYESQDFDEVLALLQSAFDDDRQSHNFEALGRLSDTSHYKRFVIKENKVVKAYLAYCTRTIRYLGISFTAASIGPVAVSPNAQGKGVGKHLMTSVMAHLSASEIEFVYIQGIPNYYQSFGFRKYIDKIKRIIPTSDVTPDSATVSIDNACKEPAVFKELFDSYANTVNFSADRSLEEWQWLLDHASKSYYFFEPKVIRDQSGLALGYFCEDPYISDSPREVIFRNDKESIASALSALKKYYADKGCDTFDLKIPDNTVVANLVDSEDCERVVHDNPHGGDLLLIFDELGAAEKLAPTLHHLLSGVESQFEAQVALQNFTIHFGVQAGGTFATVEEITGPSPVNFVDFIAGRICDESCADIETTPAAEYAKVQEMLFGKLPKFVFQGDNM